MRFLHAMPARRQMEVSTGGQALLSQIAKLASSDGARPGGHASALVSARCMSETAVWATKRQGTKGIPRGTSSEASGPGLTVAVHFPELPQLLWSQVLFACESDGIPEGYDLRVKR
jgi:hypothetical protein